MSKPKGDAQKATAQSEEVSMRENDARTNRRIPLAIRVTIWGIIATLVAALLGVFADDIHDFFIKPPGTPTPACLSADDILVKFNIVGKNDELIAVLTPGETFSIEPGLIVYFQARITPVYGGTLPSFECTWTNAAIATEGKLLHSAGCTVDYRSGQKVITDAASLQLSQPSCPALAPYPLFIMPKP